MTNKSTDDVENFSTIGIIKEFEEPPTSDDDSINNNYIYNKLMMIQMSILNLIVLIKQIQQQKAIQSQRNLFKILQILKQILLLFLKMNKNVNALLKFWGEQVKLMVNINGVIILCINLQKNYETLNHGLMLKNVTV